MSRDQRILNVGLAAHAGAAVFGVLGGLMAIIGPLDLAAGSLMGGLPLLAIVTLFGLLIGAISGGWAWILVGGVDWVHRIWIGLSAFLTMAGIGCLTFHVVASAAAC